MQLAPMPKADLPAAQRICPRCARPFTRAGRLIDGKPVCPTYGNATRPPMICVRCSRPTKRPVRSDEDSGLICEPCARRDTHATCRTCRRHRPIARRDDDGHPICRDCAVAVPITHDCPDCSVIVLGGGLGPCPPCGLRRRTMRAVHAAAEDLRHPWARELLVAFHTSLDYHGIRGDMVRHVPASVAFVASLDRALSRLEEINQAVLLDLHGAEGLRRQERLVAFLVRRLNLPWDHRAGIAHSAQRVVSKTIGNSNGKGSAQDLVAFHEVLTASVKPLSDRSMKSYISAAQGLIEAAGVDRSADLTQHHVNAWLRQRPGRTNDLGRFLFWLGETGGPALDVRPRAKTTARARERATLQTAKMLLGQLATCNSPATGRALLARAIAIVHGLPIESVLGVGASGVKQQNDRIEIRIDDVTIVLSGELSEAFVRFVNGPKDMPFTGRSGITPGSIDGTRYHLHTVKR